MKKLIPTPKDKIYIDALIYATKQIMQTQDLMWSFHGTSQKDRFLVQGAFRDYDEKQKFYNAVKLFSLSKNLNECVVISEAWFRQAKLGETIIGDVENHPDKYEALLVMHVKRINNELYVQMRLFNIERSKDQVLLHERKEMDNWTDFAGEMLTFIAPREVTEEVQRRSKDALAFGIQKGFLPDISITNMTKMFH